MKKSRLNFPFYSRGVSLLSSNIAWGCLFGFCLMSCASVSEWEHERQPHSETRQIAAGYETVFNSVVRTLTAEGFPVRFTDREAGIIDTDFQQHGGSILTLNKRSRVNAIIGRADEHSTQVTLNFQSQVQIDDPQNPMALHPQPNTWVNATGVYKETYDRLFSAIAQAASAGK